MKTFGQLLRDFRLRSFDSQQGKKMTQGRLADYLVAELGLDSLTTPTISNWERDKYQIHKDDRFILLGLIRVLHMFGGIETAVQANRLLQAGNYRPLNQQEQENIDPNWLSQLDPQPPPPESTTLLASVPPPPIHFRGREKDAEAVSTLLKDQSQAAVIAVQGMGGVGKTAFVQHLAAYLQTYFTGGIFWADLGAHNGRYRTILIQWAKSIQPDFSAPADLPSLLDQMRALLAQRQDTQGPVLLIVDDVRRHWLDALKAIERIRPGQAALLLTLRAKNLAPVGAVLYPLHTLPQNEALPLLEQLAGSSLPQANPGDVYRLLDMLAGLPLAIELAGAHLKAAGSHRLPALVIAIQDQADKALNYPGHPGIAATFATTYQTLPEDAQKLFRWLAVFADAPLTLNFVSKVVRLSQNKTQSLLENLCTHAFLSKSSETAVAYHLHPLLHQYANLLLAGLVSPEVTSDLLDTRLLRRTLVDHFSQDDLEDLCFDLNIAYDLLRGITKRAKVRSLLLETNQADQLLQLVQTCQMLRPELPWPGLTQPDTKEQHLAEQRHLTTYTTYAQKWGQPDPDSWSRLDAALSNLLLAATRAAQAKDIHSLVSLESSLLHDSFYLNVRAYFADAVRFLQTSLKAQEDAGVVQYQARTRNKLAYFFWRQGQYETAKIYAQAGLEMARRTQNQEQEADSLRYLGMIYDNLGQKQRTRSCFQQELAIRERLDDPNRLLDTQRNLATLQIVFGDYEAAHDTFAAILAVSEQNGQVKEMAKTLANRGVVYLYQGRYEKARQDFERSLQDSKAIDFQLNIAVNNLNSGILHTYCSRYGQALSCLEEAVKQYEVIGYGAYKTLALAALADLYNQVGHYSRAHEYLAQAESELNALGDKEIEVEYLTIAADLVWAQGQVDLAEQLYRKLIAAAAESNVVYFEVQGQLGLARCLLSGSDSERRQAGSALAKTAHQTCLDLGLAGCLPRAQAYLAWAAWLAQAVETAVSLWRTAHTQLRQQKHIHGSEIELYGLGLQILMAAQEGEAAHNLSVEGITHLENILAQSVFPVLETGFWQRPGHQTLGNIWRKHHRATQDNS